MRQEIDKLENQKEAILIAKTNKPKETEKQIKKMHSYDLPAIIRINVKANTEFENWVKKQT